MTGADLANLVNEAALLAARRGRDAVSQRDFTESLEKVQLGTARNVVIPEQDRKRTAYHEAGHALLGMLQLGADPVRKVSIIPRGRALGVTFSAPEQDRYGNDEAYLRGRIIGALGGMAAEQEIFNVVTTGAESDLQAVTRIARSMIGRWGMSERIGRLSVLPAEGDPGTVGISEETLNAVDEEARRITDECYGEARRLLAENRSKLDRIVEQLLAHETLDEAEVYAAAGIQRANSGRAGCGSRLKAKADSELKKENSMTASAIEPLCQHDLDLMFREARTFSVWLPQPVEPAVLRQIYEVAKLPPTSANSQPARFVFLTTPESKARLLPLLAPANVEKTGTAPVTAIIAWDNEFYERLANLTAASTASPPPAHRKVLLKPRGGIAARRAQHSTTGTESCRTFTEGSFAICPRHGFRYRRGAHGPPWRDRPSPTWCPDRAGRVRPRAVSLPPVRRRRTFPAELHEAHTGLPAIRNP